MRKPVVAILAQGAMAAAIAARASAHGVRVLTCREGRSAAGALRAALTASQPALSARRASMVPSMCGKAYRRAGKVAEVAAFAQEDPVAGAIYRGAVTFHARLPRRRGSPVSPWPTGRAKAA